MENSFNVNWKIQVLVVAILFAIVYAVGYYIFKPNEYQYQAAPISGKVVDQETGMPVEGVNVAVYWQLYSDSLLGGLGGRVATDVMGVSETVTDKDGFYHIPGWGPKVVKGDYLGEESPMIGFYKAGYEFKQVYNSNMTLLVNKDYISEGYEYSKKETEKGDVYTSNWDGVVIELDKEKNNIDDVIKNLEKADDFIDQILWGRGCKSELIGNFITSYSSEAKSVEALIKRKYPKKYRFASFSTFEGLYDCSPVQNKEND